MAKKTSKPNFQPKKAAKKAVKKAAPKKFVKERKYKTESERTPYKNNWKAKKDEKERLAFCEYYDSKYPRQKTTTKK